MKLKTISGFLLGILIALFVLGLVGTSDYNHDLAGDAAKWEIYGGR